LFFRLFLQHLVVIRRQTEMLQEARTVIGMLPIPGGLNLERRQIFDVFCQLRPAQIRSLQEGPDKFRLAEIRIAEVCFAEIRVTEVGSAKIRFGKICGAKVGQHEIGLMQIRSAEIRMAEIRSPEVCLLENRSLQGCSFKIRSFEVHPAEIRPDIRIFHPPSIPYRNVMLLDSFMDQFDVLFLCHHIPPTS